jgi:transcriptional regulator with XRE-family HTH domain
VCKIFVENAFQTVDREERIYYTLLRLGFIFIKLSVYFYESFTKITQKFTNIKLREVFMELGAKLKEIRQQKNLTQEELADRCELTKGYISQLENDLTSPSIATLCDLLNALGSNLSDFFHEESEGKIVFTESEYIEKQSEGMIWNWVIPNAQKNMMEPVLVELEPGAATQTDFPHEGEEFGFVMEGKIAIVRAGKQHRAKKGESFYFTSNKEHYIVNIGKGKARFLWISTPPNF